MTFRELITFYLRIRLTRQTSLSHVAAKKGKTRLAITLADLTPTILFLELQCDF